MRRFLKRLLESESNSRDIKQFQAVLYPLLCTLYLSNNLHKKFLIYFRTHVGVRRKSFCSSDSSIFSVSGGLSVFSSMGDFKVDFFGFFFASHRMPPSGQVSLHLKL